MQCCSSRFLIGSNPSCRLAASVTTLEKGVRQWTTQPPALRAVPLPKPPCADPMAGELVSETFGYDGGRQVTVYVPPDPAEAIVFAADGERISRWGAYLEAAAVPPTMIVGVHGLADETQRRHEYSPVFDADRFAAHERFFLGDVGQWGRSRLESHCLSSAPPCSVLRRAGSLRSRSGSGIRTSTVRSSPARRAPVTNQAATCRAAFRVPTLSQAHWNGSSSTTRPVGRSR